MIFSIPRIIIAPIKEINYYKNVLFNPHRFKIQGFSQKIPLFIEKKRYILKTAFDLNDLSSALKLRFRVFYNELLNRRVFWGIDIDKYDISCDHIIIIDKSNNRCVGTYRANCSSFSESFYCESEFNMDNIKRITDTKLELGRACIDPDSRNGAVIALLWKGIYEYVKASNSRYIFGVSSIKNTDPETIANLSIYLNKFRLNSDLFQVYPKKKFILKNHDHFYKKLISEPGLQDMEKAKSMIPALLKGYLKQGASICGEPAFDKAFKCIDYFTILDMNKLSNETRKRFE